MSGKETKLDPAHFLRLRRLRRQKEEDLTVFVAVNDKNLDLSRRMDPGYLCERARNHFSWSPGRLKKVIERIYERTLAEVRRENRAMERGRTARGDAKNKNRDDEGLYNDNQDASGEDQ